MINKYALLTVISTVFYLAPVNAIDYYKSDFNNGIKPVSNPSPVWTLPPIFDNTYGPGNHFEISSTTSHSGTHSLKFTYEGRNGFCNTCGTVSIDQKQGLVNVTFFVADNGKDLTDTTNRGPSAAPGRLVYNKSGGFSKWEIVSIENDSATNDKLNLKLLKPGIGGETVINGGDTIAIAKQCGIDGTVGGDKKRRSDCNLAINWFGNISITDQQPGSSIFRRMYLKAELTSPNVRQKLGYFRPDNGGPLNGEVIFFGQTANGVIVPQVVGLKKYGAPKSKYFPGNGLPVGLKFERSKWYYVEQEYHAATAKVFDTSGVITEYNTDGYYKLWFSASGSEPAQGNPTLEVTGLSLPPIANKAAGSHISFWGNFQHWVHVIGSWYLDDFVISDAFNGPVPGNNNDIAPPKSPATNN